MKLITACLLLGLVSEGIQAVVRTQPPSTSHSAKVEQLAHGPLPRPLPTITPAPAPVPPPPPYPLPPRPATPLPATFYEMNLPSLAEMQQRSDQRTHQLRREACYITGMQHPNPEINCEQEINNAKPE